MGARGTITSGKDSFGGEGAGVVVTAIVAEIVDGFVVTSPLNESDW